MGKKKNKYRLQRYCYNEQEFISAVCNKCKLCKSGTSPDFCYGMYTEDPKRFVKVVLKNLCELVHWFQVKSSRLDKCSDENVEQILSKAFCKTGFCKQGDGQNCKYIAGCLQTFRKQMFSREDNTIHFRKTNYPKVENKHRKKGKKVVYVQKAEPIFFCNERFKEEVSNILNGDDN